MTDSLGIPEIEELIGAYALDAVEPEEREAIEAHLVDCPRCRAELAEHLEAASYLSYSGAAAPEELWGRIVSALEEPPPAMRLEVVGREPRRSSAGRPARRVAWVLAAAAAVIVVVMAAGLIHQSRQIDDLRHTSTQEALSRSVQAAMANPASQRIDLISPTGQKLTATAVISPSGTGYLMAADLPALSADHTYQLWGESGSKLVSLGVLGPSPHTVAFSAHATYKGLAITEEVAGGVVSPTQAPVLASRAI